MASKKEKKIFLEESDGLESLLTKLEDAGAEKLVLSVPESSPLEESLENFHVIREKARILKKDIVIESSSEIILEHASASGLTAINPKNHSRERAFSDIVMTKPRRKIVLARPIRESEEAVDEKEKEEGEFEEEREKKLDRVFSAIQKTKRTEEKNIHTRFEKKKEREETKGKAKKYVLAFILLLLVVGGGVGAFYLLPEAAVELVLKRTEKQFNENVLISINATTPKLQNGQIILPGELLSANKNAQIEISAQGKTQVNEKAKGKLTVWNAFDKNPQTLVATTRFESPEGKIFRLVKQITVPGAKSEGGKLVPASIEAEVIADSAGDSFNVPAQKNWRIPGFKGTPRYEGFYAENALPMAGGFSGERPQATEEDRKAGEEKLAKTLESALTAQMNILLSEKFTLIPGATRFAITKTEIQADAGRADKGLLYGEAEMKKMVFIEEMFKIALAERFAEDLPEGAQAESFSASYGEPTIDWVNGTMQVQITGTAVFTPAVDSEKIVSDITGKNERELRDYVFNLPGLDNAKASLWPFWVKSVPLNPDRIKILVK